MSTTKHLVTAAGAIALLLLGACGGGGTEETADTSTDTAGEDTGGGENVVTYQIAITAPDNGSVAAGSLTLRVEASPLPDGIELFVDGEKAGDVPPADPQLAFDTTAKADGAHAITAKGRWGSETRESAPRDVTFDNGAPTIDEAAFDLFHVISGAAAPVPVPAADAGRLAKVELAKGGTVIATATEPPFSPVVDTTGMADGVIWVLAVATDSQGRQAVSNELPLVVLNNGALVEPDEGNPDTEWEEWESPIPATEIDVKFHWDMHGNVKSMLAVVVITDGSNWRTRYDFGTGWCPHSGTTLKSESSEEMRAAVAIDASELSLATFAPDAKWFFHIAPLNPSAHQGEVFTFKTKLFELYP